MYVDDRLTEEIHELSGSVVHRAVVPSFLEEEAEFCDFEDLDCETLEEAMQQNHYVIIGNEIKFVANVDDLFFKFF